MTHLLVILQSQDKYTSRYTLSELILVLNYLLIGGRWIGEVGLKMAKHFGCFLHIFKCIGLIMKTMFGNKFLVLRADRQHCLTNY